MVRENVIRFTDIAVVMGLCIIVPRSWSTAEHQFWPFIANMKWRTKPSHYAKVCVCQLAAAKESDQQDSGSTKRNRKELRCSWKGTIKSQ